MGLFIPWYILQMQHFQPFSKWIWTDDPGLSSRHTICFLAGFVQSINLLWLFYYKDVVQTMISNFFHTIDPDFGQMALIWVMTNHLAK